ncbi:hypothetical protein NOZE110980_14880 [Nocardioides zeicaulis]
MEHHLTPCRQVVTGRGRRHGRALGVEIEGGLGAGEVTERSGTPRTQRRRRAECLQCRGTVLDGGVEVVDVGEVELGLHPHQAVVVDVPRVEGDVPGVVVEVLVGLEVLVVLTRLEVGPGLEAEVVPLDRLGDEPVQLRAPDLPRDGGDLGVDPPGRLDRQRRNRVDGGLGHQPCPPGRDAAGVDLRPQAGEPVAQLERVPDQLLGCSGGDAPHRAELGDAELRHQRTPVAGDGLLVVEARHAERGSVVDRLGRVEVSPACGQLELTGSSGILGPPLTADRGEQAGGAEVVDLVLHMPLPRIDHVFDCTFWHRQSSTAQRTVCGQSQS